MKTNLIVFITVMLLTMSNTSFSQYNIRELKLRSSNSSFSSMRYSNSNGEKGISVFEYDDDGRLLKSSWRLLDNSRSSVNYYKYDQRGNITEKYREFSDGLTSTESFGYNSDNQLLTESFHRSDGFSNSVKYIYSTDGEVVNAEWSGYHGWFDGQITFNYNDAALIIKGKILQNEAEVGYIDFIYDQNDRLIEEYWEFIGSYSQTFTYYY